SNAAASELLLGGCSGLASVRAGIVILHRHRTATGSPGGADRSDRTPVSPAEDTVNTQEAISRAVQPGTRIPTPSGRSAFEVAQITTDALVLLLGPKRTRTRIPWSLLDQVFAAVPADRWMQVGAMHSSSSEPETLEALLKPA